MKPARRAMFPTAWTRRTWNPLVIERRFAPKRPCAGGSNFCTVCLLSAADWDDDLCHIEEEWRRELRPWVSRFLRLLVSAPLPR